MRVALLLASAIATQIRASGDSGIPDKTRLEGSPTLTEADCKKPGYFKEHPENCQRISQACLGLLDVTSIDRNCIDQVPDSETAKMLTATAAKFMSITNVASFP